MKRDEFLEAIDLLDQLAHVMFMSTRGTAWEGKARDISDRIGKLNQRVGTDGVAALMDILDGADGARFPPKR